jgi:hypothetical protein
MPPISPNPFALTKTVLKKLAAKKLAEANTLFAAGHYHGSCYIVGYVIEFAFKARICKLLKLTDYPDKMQSYKTHNLKELVILAGLSAELTTKTTQNIQFKTYWETLINWTSEIRYRPIDSITQQTAIDTIQAVQDPQDGIFTWLKLKW